MATKTINLTGAEVAVTGLDGANAHIRNDGTEVIYAAKTAGITTGADGVLSIPAGQAATVYGISGTVYMLGTGSAQIISNDYSELPFKTSATSGGSGADEVARAAINAHSGNAEIHVTAEEKAAWDAKAELADIPDKLPADGGNADTVGDLPAGYFLGSYTKFNYHYTNGAGTLAISIAKEEDHMFAFNFTDTPTAYGFIDVSSFDGEGFSPAPFGLVRQVWTDWANPSERFVRIYKATSETDGTWTDWSRCNADTLDGKHASDFALTENKDLGDYLSSKSGDIRALVKDLPSGGFIGNTDRLPNITGFPIAGDNLITWSKSVYSVNGLRYGTLQVRSMTQSNLPVYQCGVYNDGRYTDWQKLCDGGNAATLETHPASDFVLKSDYDALAARVAALEGGTT